MYVLRLGLSVSRAASTLNGHHVLIGTGEHGIGEGKRKYLYDELGVGTVNLMKMIKQTIDPLNLLNPGKVRLSSVQFSST